MRPEREQIPMRDDERISIVRLESLLRELGYAYRAQVTKPNL
jgi:hypothetical protein